MFNKIYDKIKLFILENIKFLISLSILIFIFTYELPYVVYTPGGLVNLNDRINIDEENKENGSINMSYVSMRKGNLPNILLSFLIDNWDLKKSSDITSNNESVDDLLNVEKIYMESSVDNATILAYQKAGKDIKITKKINHVTFIDSKAKTNIKLEDIILSVDSVKVNDISDLKEVLNHKDVGDKVNLVVNRNGKNKDVYATVLDYGDVKKIGIGFLTTYKYQLKPKMTIKTKDSESGSSGGLMLSLAIYNELISDDLTKGRKIVGTGTISLDGLVGAIDGVKYKMLGAQKNNANIFLCPEENYKEALKVKKEYNLSLTLKSVKTFDEAVEYLLNS